MVDERLTVEITGDTSGLEAAGRRSVKVVSDVDKAVTKSAQSTDVATVSTKQLANAQKAQTEATLKSAEAFGVADLALAQYFVTANNFINTTVSGFIEFEQTLVDVVKVINAFNGQPLDSQPVQDLVRSVQQLGSEIPIANQELLVIGQRLGQLGFLARSTADSIGQDLPNAIETVAVTASALGVSAEEAGSAFGVFRNLFLDLNTPVERQIAQLARFGDVLNDLQNNTAATSQFLFDFNRRVGATAQTLGFSFQQVSSFGAAVAQLGISAEVGGTALQGFFTRATQRSEVFAEALGVTRDEFERDFNTDAYATILRFLERLTELTPEYRAQIVGQITDSQRAITVLNGLANQTGLLTQAVGLANQAYAEGTSVQNEFALTSQTLGAEVQRLANNLNTALTTGFGRIAEFLQPIIEAVNAFITAFPNLSAAVAVATVGLAAFTVAFTAIAILLPKIRIALSSVVESIDRINAKYNAATQSSEDFNEELEETDEDSGVAQQALDEAGQALDEFSDKTEKAKKSFEELLAEFREAPAAAQRAAQAAQEAAAVQTIRDADLSKVRGGDLSRQLNAAQNELGRNPNAVNRQLVERLLDERLRRDTQLQRASARSAGREPVANTQRIIDDIARFSASQQGQRSSAPDRRDGPRALAESLRALRSGPENVGTDFLDALAKSTVGATQKVTQLDLEIKAADARIQSVDKSFGLVFRKIGRGAAQAGKQFGTFINNNLGAVAGLSGALGGVTLALNQLTGLDLGFFDDILLGVSSLGLALGPLKAALSTLTSGFTSFGVLARAATVGIAGIAVAALSTWAVAIINTRSELNTFYDDIANASRVEEALETIGTKISELSDAAEEGGLQGFFEGIRLGLIAASGGFEDIDRASTAAVQTSVQQLQVLSRGFNRLGEAAGEGGEDAVENFRLLFQTIRQDQGVEAAVDQFQAIQNAIQEGNFEKAAADLRKVGVSSDDIKDIALAFADINTSSEDSGDNAEKLLEFFVQQENAALKVAKAKEVQLEIDQLLAGAAEARRRQEEQLVNQAVQSFVAQRRSIQDFEAFRRREAELTATAFDNQLERQSNLLVELSNQLAQAAGGRLEVGTTEGGLTEVTNLDGLTGVTDAEKDDINDLIFRVNELRQSFRDVQEARERALGDINARENPLKQAVEDAQLALDQFNEELADSGRARGIARATANAQFAQQRGVQRALAREQQQLDERRFARQRAEFSRQRAEARAEALRGAGTAGPAVAQAFDLETTRQRAELENSIANEREQSANKLRSDIASALGQVDQLNRRYADFTNLAGEPLPISAEVASIVAEFEKLNRLGVKDRADGEARLRLAEELSDLLVEAANRQIEAQEKLKDLNEEIAEQDRLRAVSATQAAEAAESAAVRQAGRSNRFADRQAIGDAAADTEAARALDIAEQERQNTLRETALTLEREIENERRRAAEAGEAVNPETLEQLEKEAEAGRQAAEFDRIRAERIAERNRALEQADRTTQRGRQALEEELALIDERAQQEAARVAAGEDADGAFEEARDNAAEQVDLENEAANAAEDKAVAEQQLADLSAQTAKSLEDATTASDALKTAIEGANQPLEITAELWAQIRADADAVQRIVTGDRVDRAAGAEAGDITDTGSVDTDTGLPTDSPEAVTQVAVSSSQAAQALTDFATALDEGGVLVLNAATTATASVNTFSARVDALSDALTDDLPDLGDSFEKVVNSVNNLSTQISALDARIDELEV